MSSGCQVKNPGEEHAFVSKRDYENSLGSVACECGGAVDVLEDTSLLLVEDACGKVSFGSQLNACMGTVSLPLFCVFPWNLPVARGLRLNVFWEKSYFRMKILC